MKNNNGTGTGMPADVCITFPGTDPLEVHTHDIPYNDPVMFPQVTVLSPGQLTEGRPEKGAGQQEIGLLYIGQVPAGPGLPSVRMCKGMVTDHMPLIDYPIQQEPVIFGFPATDKKGSFRMVPVKQFQYLTGGTLIGSIIKSQVQYLIMFRHPEYHIPEQGMKH